MDYPHDGMETIAERCRGEDGLVEVSLGDLREELGYKKLGKWVLAEVEESLEKAKLGFFPTWILDPSRNTEPRQWQTIWVYERDGDLRAQVIDAVLHPEKHNVKEVMNTLVADHPETLTAEQKLERIRVIVSA
jgi:hypothetical protein